MLATADNVREYCNLSSSVEDNLLIPHMNAARRELIAWIGSTKYAEAEAAGAEEEIRVDLTEAEVFLAYHFGIDYLGVKHTQEGFTAEGQIGDGNYRYLGPDSIKKMKTEAYERARKAAAPYMTKAGTFHSGKVGAADG